MKKSYILAFSAIFFWSTMATVSKLLLGSFSGIFVLLVSSVFAFLFLLIKNIFTHNLLKLREYSFKDIIIMVLIGLPGTFVYNLLYYIGAAIMPASQAFIINYLWPIMSIIFACIILKDKLNLRKIIAILMSFCGVSLVAGTGDGGFGGAALLGAVSIFFAAVSYGLFTALNQKFQYDKDISLMLVYGAIPVITAVICAFTNGFVPVGVADLLGFAWNGALVMGVANTAWAIALESGETAKISNLAYITPFASLVWIAIFLKESINPFAFLGLLIIVAGILIQLGGKKKN